jgi:nitrogenase-associated protein
MATIVFYEKPGCASNTRQKVLLAAAGHTVLARSVLTEAWSAQRLRAFFGTLPVAAWFNPSAPRIQSGEVQPDALDESAALGLMLADPLLIRRPLLEVDGAPGGFRSGRGRPLDRTGGGAARKPRGHNKVNSAACRCRAPERGHP